jgi:hypothetical protein
MIHMQNTTTTTAPTTHPHPDECYYCGTLNLTSECCQRNGEHPCVPGSIFLGSTDEVRRALQERGLR